MIVRAEKQVEGRCERMPVLAETELARAAAGARLQAELFAELMHEVQHGPPGARLSARLRAALERLPPPARAAVVSRRAGGCAALLVAAARGATELVEYLVHVCCAPLEQRGRYRAGPGAAHRVTPLWAAAAAGRARTVRALADAGADLDAPSDSGSTPARAACFMSHAHVLRLLAERGADLARASHRGGTCLINSVQCPRLLRYLLARGVPVDARDAERKTALHYAAAERRTEAVRVLLRAGASPRARSLAGEDAVRVGARRGAGAALELLLARARPPPAREADALELVGAAQLERLREPGAALAAWRRATELRAAPAGYLRKRGHRVPAGARAALGGAREWETREQLDALDGDALRTQALLVAVRVLGPHHPDTLNRFMYRGAADVDAMRHARGLRLWEYAVCARVRRDSLVAADTAHALCALTRLLHAAPAACARAAAARLLARLARAAPRAARLAAARPACRAQLAAWDGALRCALQLAALAGAAARASLARLVRARPRTAAGDTLLHLACARAGAPRSPYFPRAVPARAPCVRLVRALLAAGADAGARNRALATALHAAAVPYNFSTELVRALVAGGAHLCTPNRLGEVPAELVLLCAGSRVRVLRHVTLACLAARALAALAAPPPGALPAELRAFLDLHRALPDPEAPPARREDEAEDRGEGEDEDEDEEDLDLDMPAPEAGDARY